MSDELKKAQEVLEKAGYGVLPPNQYRPDLEEDFLQIWEEVRPYTMTSLERAYALYQSLHYLLDNKISGALVECGVWKGGSCMLMARVLQSRKEVRDLYLLDTFTGMTMPTDEDKIAFTGQKVGDRWEENWWAAGLEEVRAVMEATGYPQEHLHFVPGDVAKTLSPGGCALPQEIALLRLDTDWYESTKLELEVLYPLLVSLGVLIIDDYGHFEGARKAVDEYWARLLPKPLLQRIDYTGRVVIKP